MLESENDVAESVTILKILEREAWPLVKFSAPAQGARHTRVCKQEMIEYLAALSL